MSLLVLVVQLARAYKEVNQMPYYLESVEYLPNGITGVLKYNSTFPFDSSTIQDLQLKVEQLSNSQIRVQITDNENQRWQVPIVTDQMSPGAWSEIITYKYTNTPFSLQVLRQSTKEVIFNIDSTQLFQFENEQITFSNYLSYNINVYGLGQRNTDFKLNQGSYTLWAYQNQYLSNNPNGFGNNLYSSHPFYLAEDPQNQFFGIFFCNSNAMEATVANNSVTFKTIGGIIDLFVFAGPQPGQVIQQYHQIIGTAALPPYWALGWHHGRTDLDSLFDWKYLLSQYLIYQIPLDAILADVSYTDNYAAFTVNGQTFPSQDIASFQQKANELQKNVILTIPSGLQVGSQAEKVASQQFALIKSSQKEGQFSLGSQYNQDVHYMDWFNPSSNQILSNLLESLNSQLGFQGIIYSGNEAFNQCNGNCGIAPAINNSTLPFTPGKRDLNENSIYIGDLHYTNSTQSLYTEYNAHSLFGLMQSQSTQQYYRSLNQRGFIQSESTFPGSGRFAQTWLGQSVSSWDFLKQDLVNVMNYQMFGIPMVGGDICGTTANSTSELCSRWTQIATLFPISRFYFNATVGDKDPWAFDDVTLNTINFSIRVKYALIQHFYTLLYKQYLDGGMMIKPTFFNYINQTDIYSNFLIGDDLLVHPVLEEGVSQFVGNFPQADIWYDFFYGNKVSQNQQLNAKLPGIINIHVRGGSIIPKLDGWYSAQSALQMRNQNIQLIVAMSQNGQASGSLILDDGVTYNYENQDYTEINYTWSFDKTNNRSILQIQSQHFSYIKSPSEFPYIFNILVYGCQGPMQRVSQNSGQISSDINAELDYDDINKICSISLGSQMATDQLGILYFYY